MARGRESQPPQPNRPKRRRSVSSEAEQETLPPSPSPPSPPPAVEPAPTSFRTQHDYSPAADYGSAGAHEAAPGYSEVSTPSPTAPPYSQPSRSNSNVPRRQPNSQPSATHGVEDPIQRHRLREQEQLELALSHSRDEERQIREQRERERHAQEEDELARVLEHTRVAEVESARERENMEMQQLAQEEEQLARILRESVEAERMRLEEERRMIEERERAFGSGQPIDRPRATDSAANQVGVRPGAATGQTRAGESIPSTRPAPGNLSTDGRSQAATARVDSVGTPAILGQQRVVRQAPEAQSSVAASGAPPRTPSQTSRRSTSSHLNFQASYQPAVANAPSYPLRGQPSLRGQPYQPRAANPPPFAVARAPSQVQERRQAQPRQRPNSHRQSSTNASQGEHPTLLRVPTGDLQRATQDSLQQRALQILATAEEGSPAYIRAMAAFETPAAAIDAEDGLPEHLAPPAYERVVHDKILNHMEWTTDGKGDEPGRKRRLTERDWNRMKMWIEILEKEKAGEGDEKGENCGNGVNTAGAQQREPELDVESSVSAGQASGTIVDLLDRSSTIAVATRTSQAQTSPAREIRATALRDRVDGAQRRDNERFNLRFSRIPGRG